MDTYILYIFVITMTLPWIPEVHSHGRLINPASRSSMWRYGFDVHVNYNDNELFCGGAQHQRSLGGKCGVCGDPWDGQRQNEAGGKFASGIITRTYKRGQNIPITVQITANHKGWFEFRLCPTNNRNIKATPECLNRNLLRDASSGRTRIHIGTRSGDITSNMQLPPGVTCSQCVLQWRYHTGNSWGEDPITKQGCIGCGPQEEFYGCADIAIEDDGQNYPRENPDSNPQTTLYFQTTQTPYHPENNDDDWYDTDQPTWPQDDEDVADDDDVNPNNGDVPVCKSAGVYANDPAIDSWCTNNCAGGYCPSSHCICISTKSFQGQERQSKITQLR